MGQTERVFLAFVAVAMVAALGVDAMVEGHGMRVLAFPAIVGAVVLMLCALRLWHLRRTRDGPADPAAQQTASGWTIGTAAGFAAVLPVVMVFGLTIGLPAYVAAYVRLRGEGWRAAVVAALLTLATVLLFVELLGMQLPEAPLAWP